MLASDRLGRLQRAGARCTHVTVMLLVRSCRDCSTGDTPCIGVAHNVWCAKLLLPGFSHTAFRPVIDGVGSGFDCYVMVAVVVAQPVAVTVSVSRTVPLAPLPT